MPIFAGDWLDGEGVPFDADSFPITTRPAGGTSRRRIHGRRGGSGSPPGKYHGSDAQAATRLSFGLRTREYVDMPEASPATQWQIDGRAAPHFTRDGSHILMHGQAFYPRSSVPPDYGRHAFPSSPDDTKTFPPIDAIACYFPDEILDADAALHFTADYDSGIYSGISIFQVNPRSRGNPWEIKHTRLAHSYEGLHGIEATWTAYPFNLIWSCKTNDELRILIRVWNHQAFSPWTPITSVPYP